jgi:hypothetical protein
MRRERLYTLLEANPLTIPLVLVLLIIILGGVGVYLAEHKHQGANITTLGDAFWWAIVTITTVGYGEYFPLTLAGPDIFAVEHGIDPDTQQIEESTAVVQKIDCFRCGKKNCLVIILTGMQLTKYIQ